MSGFEFNKIVASIILAIIIFTIIGLLGNYIIKIGDNDKEIAYKIDIPEKETRSADMDKSNLENIESIESLLINASLENGEKLFKKCAACHNYKKGSKSKIGPNLWDLIDRKKGFVEGFAYSNALINSGGVWSYKNLNEFLYNPKANINGTKMNFAGLKKAQDRADIIYWLRQHSDNPVSLP